MIRRRCFRILAISLIILGISACYKTKSTSDKPELYMNNSSIKREEPFKVRRFKAISSPGNPLNAVSYGCYRKGQAPWGEGPTKNQIRDDLGIINRYWDMIRVYNADDTTERILQVIREENLPIKVMLGIWLENETNEAMEDVNKTNLLKGIELANQYNDIVNAVNVGNETQVYWSGHKISSTKLINYIRFVRNQIGQPVSTADDYNFWNKEDSNAIEEEVDFIVTHIYPLWNSKNLDESIEWLTREINNVMNLHSDKQVVIGEIGWATRYNPDKKGPGEQGTLVKGEVSINAQERFLLLLSAWVSSTNITTYLFEVFDESWKGGAEQTGANEIEKNWGVFYENREPKQSFINHQAQTNKRTSKEALRRRK